MNEVGAADRERLLRSKRAELSGVVGSRKRKLRELFAVCDNEAPIPKVDLSNPDAPPTTIAEGKFLEVTDILLDRLFDESNLPTRRQLRSTALKNRSPIRKISPEARTNDASRKAAKQPRDAPKPRKSRAPTPSSRSDGGKPILPVLNRTSTIAVEIPPMQKSLSKSSQTDLPAEERTIVAEKKVEEALQDVAKPQPKPQILIQDAILPPADLESKSISTEVESKPSSPGVDPRKAMPILPEDAAQLPGPIIFDSNDPQHKAATVHLPPKEAQEERLQETEKELENRNEAVQLSINLPPPDGGKNAEPPLSSPGSTVDAQSATTPAMHEHSTDTSPSNESSRCDAERGEDKEMEPLTPPDLKPTAEQVAEKEEQDSILQTRMEIARDEIARSSPAAAENQLLEEQAALIQPVINLEKVNDLDSGEQPGEHSEESAVVNGEEAAASELTEKTVEVVQDVVADVEKPSTTEDVSMSGAEVPAAAPSPPQEQQPEIADSEAEEPTPTADPMYVDDVEVTTVKDSFESSVATESRPVTAPVEPEPQPEPQPEIPAPEPEPQPQPEVAKPKPEPVSQPEAAVPAPEPQPRKTSTTPATSTPQQTPSTPAAPPERQMITRVASGAMRHKSVAEILGEIPKPNASPSSERSTSKGASDSARASNSPSRSTTPQSPGTRRSLVEKAKEKERSKLSTVIFAKQPPKPPTNDRALIQGGAQTPQSSKEDYFMPLFLATASTDKRGSTSLDNLLATAHKTITTQDAYVPINENQTAKVLKRIYNLQSSNKWSLRQPKRSVEPIRQTSHWDLVIQEAKWMRTDFRGERKWKMSAARNLAFACAEFVAASPEDKQLLRVKATPPPIISKKRLESVGDHDIGETSSQGVTHPTPDLIASEEDSPMDDFDEEPRLNLMETQPPTAIFTLANDDIIFPLRRSPTADKLLNELPMYGAPLTVPSRDIPTPSNDPDRYWKRPALPLSKYVEGRMELKDEGPPRKKSRFRYETEDDDEDQVVFGEQGTKRAVLPPEQTNVALFDPEHKHIRDRIHSSHQFRPPSEFPMPLQSFFECRIPSQWTADEDHELKTLVREYSYNWSLISSMLSGKSLYTSGADRRTPWECFERWVYMEGLPTDMQKTHYFRAYTARILAAERHVLNQPQNPQLVQQNGQPAPPMRRRTTQSIRVERKRTQKHIMLVDGMRKLAKKRETNLQKQQHTAGMAALRKANEAPQPRQLPATTPQDFSRMKHEREEQMKERIALFQQRQDANRRSAQAQRAQASAMGLANGIAQNRTPAGPNMTPNGAPNGQNLQVPGQNRPRPPIPPQMAAQMANRLQVPPMQMNGVPQASMQGQLPLPNPQLDIGLVNRAQQVQQHQQIIRQQQQQQGQINGQPPQMHNSPPRVNGLPQPGFPMQNNLMQPPFNPNVNGVSTPPSNPYASSPGQAGSPRMGQIAPNQMTPHQMLEQHIRRQNPNATPEQINQFIAKQNPQFVQARQALAQNAMNANAAASAMNAAAGGNNIMAGMNRMGERGTTPQMYAQNLRLQQEQQQNAAKAAQQANAANALGGQPQAQANGNGNGNGVGMGNSAQGHAHRASSGSVQSNK